MARFCALYTAASWAPGIVHITVMGDDCSVNSATVYFVFLYSVQVLLIRKTSSFSSDCCVAVAVSSADHSCALPVWIFGQCWYYDWLVAIQTIWKVLWESTNPHESNRRVFLPLCYVTIHGYNSVCKCKM